MKKLEQHIRTFLEIALNEGLSVEDYALKLGWSATTTSMRISELGDIDPMFGGPGPGLVTLKDGDPKRIVLTPKGAALVDRIRAKK